MPKKVKTRAAKRPRSRKNNQAAAAPNSSEPEKAPGNSRFVNDLLTRGEAAELTKDGKLPLSATHIIKKKNPDGSVEVKRARYKLF
jgi:hypothetical protein